MLTTQAQIHHFYYLFLAHRNKATNLFDRVFLLGYHSATLSVFGLVGAELARIRDNKKAVDKSKKSVKKHFTDTKLSSSLSA